MIDRILVQNTLQYSVIFKLEVTKKVKFSHTRYRALGPELIPMYRQSVRK